MGHIDHHTLELYVLGSDSVKHQRPRIARHLSRCSGCRGVSKEIEEIYSDAERSMAGRARISEDAMAAVAKRTSELLRGASSQQYSPVEPRLGPLQMFAQFARRHPAVVVTGSFATVAVVGFALGISFRGLPKDSHPATYSYDSARGVLVVKNRKDEPIWEKSIRDLAQVEAGDKPRRIQYTEIVDLNSDGEREVVTTLPFPVQQGEAASSKLRVFDAAGETLSETSLGHDIRYNGSEYPAGYLGWGGVVILDGTEGEVKAKEIVTSVVGFRSPGLVARLDGRGHVVGEYWHYGALAGIYKLTGTKGQGDRVILTGINDILEGKGSRYPVILLLNPDEIRDTTESTATIGFGYERSKAEEVYLRIPLTDMDSAMGTRPGVRYLLYADSQSVRFVVTSSPGDTVPSFEYVFTRRLEVNDIIPADGTGAIHAKLLKQGRITSRFDRSYLGEMVRAVEYWDGQSWQKGYCPVRHLVAKN